jgi:hypothetical protein
VWRGQNNPLTQYANRYGEERHQAEWSSHGCQVPTSSTGVAVFGSGEHTKPDCIIARSGQCEIIEFKPKNPDAMALGERQLAVVREECAQLLREVPQGRRSRQWLMGARDFMEAVRRHCVDDGQLKFQDEVGCPIRCTRNSMSASDPPGRLPLVGRVARPRRPRGLLRGDASPWSSNFLCRRPASCGPPRKRRAGSTRRRRSVRRLRIPLPGGCRSTTSGRCGTSICTSAPLSRAIGTNAAGRRSSVPSRRFLPCWPSLRRSGA